jgi:hypothetical protein
MVVRPLWLVFAAGCFQPTGGTWTFVSTQVEGDCPDAYNPAANPVGTAELEATAPDEVSYTDPDVDVKVACPLTDHEFTCDFAETDGAVDFTDQGYAAVLTTDQVMHGTYDDAATAHGLTSVETTCEGEQCDELNADGHPACLITWYWSATADAAE